MVGMYQAPVDDMKFTLRYLVGLDRVAAIPGMDMVSEDLVDAVLEEAGKLAGDVLAPLNHAGTWPGRAATMMALSPCRTVCHAWNAMAEGGWIGLNASPDYGGQGLPQCVSAAVNEVWNASNMGFALCQLLTQGAIHALEVVGNEEQRGNHITEAQQR